MIKKIRKLLIYYFEYRCAIKREYRELSYIMYNKAKMVKKVNIHVYRRNIAIANYFRVKGFGPIKGRKYRYK